MAPIAKKVLRSTALPISTQEFIEALEKICPISSKRGFGLAISGGVDSMALAFLTSQVRQDSRISKLPLHAFIVDHGARPDSDKEAGNVSKLLGQMEIPAKILKLGWPELKQWKWPRDNPQTFSSSKFETLGRRYRYRALGLACRSLQLDSILLAHHSDDQAETLFMRLMNGHRQWGLQGMAGSSSLPESHGVYGVHHSGKPRKWDDTPAEGDFSIVPFENGDIRLYRPLLGFSKERLIATCEAADVKWFEDPTNRDASLTPRNAVRCILQKYTLPAALTKPRLLDLAKRMRKTDEELAKKADEWLNSCEIQHFDHQSGVLCVRFSECPFEDPKYQREIAARLLRRVIMQVTPQEHVVLNTLHGSVERIFPELFDTTHQVSPLTAFTIGQTIFYPILSDKEFSSFRQLREQEVVEGAESDPEDESAYRPHTPISTVYEHILKKMLVKEENSFPHMATREWRISRQGPTAHERLKLHLNIPPKPSYSSDENNNEEISYKSNPQENFPWTTWTLYDGRFWIRIQNRSSSPLCLRIFRREDSKALRRALIPLLWDESLWQVVMNKAPAGTKWTLPAIVQTDEDRVVALPSLQLGVQGVEEVVRWEVAFKKTDLVGTGWRWTKHGWGRQWKIMGVDREEER